MKSILNFSRADPGQQTSRQLAEVATDLVFWRNGEELFHSFPASALQCHLGALLDPILPAPALLCFIPVTDPRGYHEAGPTPGSIHHQP